MYSKCLSMRLDTESFAVLDVFSQSLSMNARYQLGIGKV